MNKLLLVDGNAVLHRAYYALPDWRNRSGEATAGVYGFLSMLLRAIDDLKPTHLAITFDTPAPTFRHNMYVGYQTNREKERQVSEDIWGQVEKLKTVFQLLDVPVYQLEGFEADDVIGTLSLQAANITPSGPPLNSKNQKDFSLLPSVAVRGGSATYEVVIITGDKDLMQLVDDHTFLYMPQKGLSDNQIIDSDKVMEKLGVHPNQVVDYKALVGDSSDNYPGVTGIGPKTAIHLLGEFGSFEKIYQNLVNNTPSSPPLNLRGGKQGGVVVGIPDAIKKKLVEGYEGGVLSKQLATIRRDAPVTLDITQCSLPSAHKFQEVFEKLGYKSLLNRVTERETRLPDGQDVKVKESKKQIGLFD